MTAGTGLSFNKVKGVPPEALAGGVEQHVDVAPFNLKKKRREAVCLICFHLLSAAWAA
jgi:hypothetical protein